MPRHAESFFLRISSFALVTLSRHLFRTLSNSLEAGMGVAFSPLQGMDAKFFFPNHRSFISL